MKNCTRILSAEEAERIRLILEEVYIELNIRKLREENNISINSSDSERNSGFSDWIDSKEASIKEAAKAVGGLDISKCNYVAYIKSLM